MTRWIRRQRDDRTLIYRLVMNERVYLAFGIGWIVTSIFAFPSRGTGRRL